MEAHPAFFEKSRDKAAFRQASIEIAALRERAEAGKIEVAYVDEAGFATVHPNRSAWTPVGEQHLIKARRGRRLNVLGALCSSGELISARLWCCVNSALFVGFLGLLKQRIAKPLVVILDNASIHKAKVTRPIIEHLKKQAVHLYFLPPYSPETQSHRMCVAQDEAHVDGSQTPNRGNAGSRHLSHPRQLRVEVQIRFLRQETCCEELTTRRLETFSTPSASQRQSSGSSERRS